jgi:hypothetical protein
MSETTLLHTASDIGNDSEYLPMFLEGEWRLVQWGKFTCHRKDFNKTHYQFFNVVFVDDVISVILEIEKSDVEETRASIREGETRYSPSLFSCVIDYPVEHITAGTECVVRWVAMGKYNPGFIPCLSS